MVIAYILERTTLGYELKAVGYNRDAAEYAGIQANRNIVLSMMIAGACAGLGGAAFYVGYASNMQRLASCRIRVLMGSPWPLLGANSPWGVFMAAIFFGILHSGKGFMNARTRCHRRSPDSIIATIIYFAATSVLIERVRGQMQRRRQAQNKADLPWTREAGLKENAGGAE